jgi:hypothetical protein
MRKYSVLILSPISDYCSERSGHVSIKDAITFKLGIAPGRLIAISFNR